MCYVSILDISKQGDKSCQEITPLIVKYKRSTQQTHINLTLGGSWVLGGDSTGAGDGAFSSISSRTFSSASGFISSTLGSGSGSGSGSWAGSSMGSSTPLLQSINQEAVTSTEVHSLFINTLIHKSEVTINF